MSSGDIITPTLEETGSLKLSNMRNPGLMEAAIPALDFGPGIPDFAHIYKQARNCKSNWKGAQEFKFLNNFFFNLL